MKEPNEIKFLWQGINEQGERVQGFFYAKNVQELKARLREKNIFPIKINRKFNFINSFIIRKITHKQIIDFTYQLAVLLQASIEINQALTIISSEIKHTQLKQLLNLINHQIEQGESLSKILNQYPNYFDTVYVSLITAGEASDGLSSMLYKLNHYQQRMVKIRQKISQALFYPASIAMIATLITTGLLLFVVPQFETVFESMGAHLPWLTQVVITVSKNLHHHGIHFIISIILLFTLTRYSFNKIKAFQYFIQTFFLSIPGIQYFFQMANLMRTFHILHTLLQSGLPLVKALQLCECTLTTNYYKKSMRKTIQDIEHGQSFQQALKSNCLFDQRYQQMLTVAENTGDLVPMLKILAEQSEHQFDQLLDRMSKLIEPLLMVLLAVFIGTLIIAMYLPIFKLGSIT